MDTTYKVAIGPVTPQKLPPGDPAWKVFNGSFQNVKLEQMDICAALYDGHPLTTWLQPPWRTSENFLCGQAVGLDFDTCDARSSLPMLQKEPFIAKHAALLYTTLSHTPEAPRARVMFLLDAPIHQARNFTAAVSALLWLFGTADRAAKDAVRFWYGGKPGSCQLEWLNHELPLSLVKDLIARYQASGAVAKHHITRTYAPTSASETEVMDALKAIPPWQITYDEWLAVLMALQAEFPTSGLSMAHVWADEPTEKLERRWKSFKPSGNVTGKVGIGTVFALAKERGWKR